MSNFMSHIGVSIATYCIVLYTVLLHPHSVASMILLLIYCPLTSMLICCIVAGARLPGMKSDELARVRPIRRQSAGDPPALRGCRACDLPPRTEEDSWPVQALSDVASGQEPWLVSLRQLARDDPQDCGRCDHEDGPVSGEITTLCYTVITINLVLFTPFFLQHNSYTTLYRLHCHFFIALIFCGELGAQYRHFSLNIGLICHPRRGAFSRLILLLEHGITPDSRAG